MPGVNGDLGEPWDDPAIPYLQPMAVSRPNSTGMAGEGLFSTLREERQTSAAFET
jgi:hypothetical protein